MKNKLTDILRHIITALAITGFIGLGCESLQKFTASPAGKILESLALNAATTYATGGNLDKSWAIQQGLFSISGSIPLGTPGADVIRQTVIDYAGTGNVDTRKLAGDLAAAYVAAKPTTPTAAKDATLALGYGLNAANTKVGLRHD